MAININSNFKVGSPEPLDTRNVLTKEEMLAINDATMPEVYYAVGADDGKFYLYNKDNTPSETTGKFRVFEGGDGAKIWEGTRAEYEAEKDTIEPGTLIVITDDEGSFGSVFYDCTQEEYDELPDDKLSNGIAYMISEEGSTTVKLVRNGKEISGNEDAVIKVEEIPETFENKVYVVNPEGAVSKLGYPPRDQDLNEMADFIKQKLIEIGATEDIVTVSILEKGSFYVYLDLIYDDTKYELIRKSYHDDGTSSMTPNIHMFGYSNTNRASYWHSDIPSRPHENAFSTGSITNLIFIDKNKEIPIQVYASEVELATKEYVDSLPTGGDAVVEVEELPEEIENKIYNVGDIDTILNYQYRATKNEDLENFLSKLEGVTYERVQHTSWGWGYGLTFEPGYSLSVTSSGENYPNIKFIGITNGGYADPDWLALVNDDSRCTAQPSVISYLGMADTKSVYSKDVELATKDYVKNTKAVVETVELPTEFKNNVYNISLNTGKTIRNKGNFKFVHWRFEDTGVIPDYSEDEQALADFIKTLGDISYTKGMTVDNAVKFSFSYSGDFRMDKIYGEFATIYLASDGSYWKWICRTKSGNSITCQDMEYLYTYSYPEIRKDVYSKDIELATKEYVDNLPTTDIEINVEEEATEALENIKVADVVYKVEGGDAVLHVNTMPEQIENKVYIDKEILTFKILPNSQFDSEQEYENYLEETFDKYKIQYEMGSPDPESRLDKQYVIKSPLYWDAKSWAKQRIINFRHYTSGTWQVLNENNMGHNVEQIYGYQDSRYFTDLRTFVYASEVELATKEALDGVEEEIGSINLKAAMAVDEKPVYSNGTISYIQNGVAGTTDNTDQWFYYVEDDQMYQTIWIGGIEKTILSAGEEIDALRVKLTKEDDTKKSLQAMYEDGELGGGAISMTKAEWAVYDKDSLNDKTEIIITDDVEDGGDIPIAIMSFDAPVYEWMTDSNNSSAKAVEADKDGIAVCTTKHNNTSSIMFHEIDLEGVDRKIAASDHYVSGSFITPVTFPVKKGYKYWAELNSNSIAGYIGGIKFYPFKSEVIQPLKAEDKYSTSETVVGEWIDGKPIYRKVVVLSGSLSGTVTMDSTLTYSTISDIVSLDIFAVDNENTFITVPAVSTDAKNCDVWVETTGVKVRIGSGRKVTKITMVIEYTKK